MPERSVLTAGLAGVALGTALDLAMAWMTTSGPAGDQWSFRGNGALVVPLGLGTSIVAAGWSALALRARGVAPWLGLGVSIAAVNASPAAWSVLVLVLLGGPAQTVSDWLTIPAFLWPAITFVFAVALLATAKQVGAIAALAAIVFTAAVGGGFFGAEALLAART